MYGHGTGGTYEDATLDAEIAGGGAAKSETAIDVAAANASKDLFIAVVSCKGH